MKTYLTAFCAAIAAVFADSAQLKNNPESRKDTMKYEIVELEYPLDALEPWIDAQTVQIHHDKHQAAYVANLNKALASDPTFAYEGSVENLISNLDKVPETIRTAVRNNGGGVWNHTFYWRGLSPEKSVPSPELLAAIEKSFGTFEEFVQKMSAAAVGQFGSGWAWLGMAPDGSLKICSTPNQDSPIMGDAITKCGIIPILTIDVWEHAYYLKYQNRRPDYVQVIWNLINWDRVSKRYKFVQDKHKVLL